jgi:hypothetical protein
MMHPGKYSSLPWGKQNCYHSEYRK